MYLKTNLIFVVKVRLFQIYQEVIKYGIMINNSMNKRLYQI